MKKRERLEIIRDILSAINEKGPEALPTHILYKSNLSSQMLKEYLSELQQKSFIAEIRDKRGKVRYSLTQRGFDFLKDYEVVQRFIDSYGL
ncbi:hypothetical protein D6789_02170 [Candidatus Woesearchaeota archaeon]|nr:MAG: hypothetical protein D6789_02170 [Candidatus Woesearchaeota archaeon]